MLWVTIHILISKNGTYSSVFLNKVATSGCINVTICLGSYYITTLFFNNMDFSDEYSYAISVAIWLIYNSFYSKSFLLSISVAIYAPILRAPFIYIRNEVAAYKWIKGARIILQDIEVRWLAKSAKNTETYCELFFKSLQPNRLPLFATFNCIIWVKYSVK